MAVEQTNTEERFKDIPDKVEKITEELSCKLNEVEWNNRAQELADAHRETNAQEERKKSIVAEINADIKLVKAKETKLANIVASRREQREVTVEVVYNYEKGTITKVRTDTNEEISSREMTTSERQSSLFEEGVTDANDVIESRHEEPEDGESEV
jgi:hypothetical protein